MSYNEIYNRLVKEIEDIEKRNEGIREEYGRTSLEYDSLSLVYQKERGKLDDLIDKCNYKMSKSFAIYAVILIFVDALYFRLGFEVFPFPISVFTQSLGLFALIVGPLSVIKKFIRKMNNSSIMEIEKMRDGVEELLDNVNVLASKRDKLDEMIRNNNDLIAEKEKEINDLIHYYGKFVVSNPEVKKYCDVIAEEKKGYTKKRTMDKKSR